MGDCVPEQQLRQLFLDRLHQLDHLVVLLVYALGLTPSVCVAGVLLASFVAERHQGQTVIHRDFPLRSRSLY